MRQRTVVLASSVAIVLVLGGWLGRYKYEQLRDGDSTYLLRINRFTGATARFVDLQWIDAANPLDADDDFKLLPSDQLKLVVGKGAFHGGTTFVADLYNGSEWTIREIVYRIKSGPRKGRIAVDPKDYIADLLDSYTMFDINTAVTDSTAEWERNFKSPVRLEPMAPGHDSIHIGSAGNKNVPEWTIVSARGHLTQR